MSDASLEAGLPSRRGRAASRDAALRPLAGGKLSVLAYLYLGCVLLPLVISVGPLALSPLRILCLCVTLPLLVAVLGGRYGRVFWADWLVVLHIAWMGLSFLVTEGAGAIELTGSMGLEFIGGYLIARSSIRTLDQFQQLCRCLAYTVMVLAPFALIESLTGVSPLREVIDHLPVPSAIPPADPEMRLGMHRAYTVFIHPIHFGLYASVCFALCWTALAPTLAVAPRFAMACVIGAAGFLSLSSGGILAIALQVGLIAWSTLLPANRARWWILVALFVLGYVVVDLLSNRTPIHVFMSYATFSAHTAYWRMLIFDHGIANVWANPVFGLGMADWVRPAWMHTPTVDNFWLLNAMRNGVLGFVTVAACWLAVLVPVMRRSLDGATALGQARRAWVFVMIGLSFTLFTVHVWGNVYSFVSFLLGAGVWLVAAAEAKVPVKHAADRPSASRHSRFAPPVRRKRA